MSKIKFIGDIHYGKRPSHSTRASAHTHKDKVNKALAKACQGSQSFTVQMGDLFDSYVATNNDMVRALRASRSLDIILKGNHDHAHNSYNVSALEDLQKIADDRRSTIVTEPKVFFLGEQVVIRAVPYMPTQEQFLEELDKAVESCQPECTNILILHTNMYPEGFSSSEVENNLPEAKAKELCKVFDLVVSGHEHNGCIKHGVYMVGSLFPHNFGDISDKSVLVYDTETKEVSYEKVWEAESNYAYVSPEEFLSISEAHTYDFIEIHGEVAGTRLLDLVKHMSYLFNNSRVSGIKNNTKVIRNAEASAKDLEIKDWVHFVKTQLNEEQFKMFEELK